MPRLKLLGVVVRNCSLVVLLTTSVSVSVAFSETFVAVSLTVALMTNLARGPNPVTTVLCPCCLESPNKSGLTEMSLQPLICKEIKERKKEMKTLYVCTVWLNLLLRQNFGQLKTTIQWISMASFHKTDNVKAKIWILKFILSFIESIRITSSTTVVWRSRALWLSFTAKLTTTSPFTGCPYVYLHSEQKSIKRYNFVCMVFFKNLFLSTWKLKKVYDYNLFLWQRGQKNLQGSPCSVRTLLVNILVYEWQ